jgi:hypothetical protein
MQSNQTSINYGLIGGMAAIALGLLYYLLNVRGYITYGVWFSYLALAATMVMAAKAVRSEQDGFLEFREGLKVTFLVWVIGSAILSLFTYILFNFIDTGLADVQREVVTEMMEKFMASADEQTVDMFNEAMEEQGFGLDLTKATMGYLLGLIFPGFIIALITSLILQRKRPVDFLGEDTTV